MTTAAGKETGKALKKKLKVAILFGGKSAEHEVSLRSAKNIADALDPKKYDAVLIGIDKAGRWLSGETNAIGKTGSLALPDATQMVALAPQSKGALANLRTGGFSEKIDVVFPVLHGPFGEDGTVQGLLKLAGVPFVGAGVLGSAVGMDKDVMKRLLRDADIPIGDYLVVRSGASFSFQKAKKTLGLPLFIKPANLGSSVGVSKVRNEKEFREALDLAFQFDRKVLIEEFIDGREVECAVLGNSEPIASAIGEIIPTHDFYSYEAKYLDENGARLEIPAKLPKSLSKKIQKIAVETFKALECEGMARVDMFVTKRGTVYVNEINTIPGFTNISMYPKLWGYSGLTYPQLIDRLLELALERFEEELRLKTAL